MDQAASEIWTKILDIIKKDLNPQSYQTWFVHTRPVSYEGNTMVVETPNAYFRDWLVDHYVDVTEEAARRVCGKQVGISFIVGQQLPLSAPEQDKKDAEQTRARLRKSDLIPTQSSGLNQLFTFDNFVVGSNNRFAHAASLAVAESPAKAYNPLFIYGPVGMGKTHLLQAIAHFALKRNVGLRVLYISSERFTNQLISAIQNRSTIAFRQMYRTVDILLIDDIHFMGGKETTQEEFFHTFNVLYDAHKQIILSSDRPPKDIPSLEQRLVSRFEWGLITDIQMPDLETRIAILKKKAERETVEVPDSVMFFIAEKVKTNIRELEGALIRVVAYASLTGQKITLGLAQDILKDIIREEKRISIEIIQRKIAEVFEIGVSDLRGKKRVKIFSYPRQIAMYLARTLTDLSLPQVGEYFGGRDHTTVLHACNKIQADIDKNVETKKLVENIVNKIKEG
jgi:chromosomal replication initiator protein